MDVVTKANAFLLEDDWARDLPLDTTVSPPSLASADHNGHVIYIRSLTKCAAPGLRVGAVCAKGAALERLRAARLVDDFFVPGLLQETALQLVTAASWPRHLRDLRAALRAQRNAFASALRQRLGSQALPFIPTGGMHLWLHLPAGVLDHEIAERAAMAGLLVSAGRDWYPAEPAGPRLRLSFANIRPEWITEAANILGELIDAAVRP
jgi:DNA-binding transcriptional MocR family regulator